MRHASSKGTYIAFHVRQLWLVCAAIIIGNFVLTLYEAFDSLHAPAHNIADTSRRELEHYLNSTWALGTALSRDQFLASPAVNKQSRSLALKAYDAAYGMFIGIADVDGALTSPQPGLPDNIAHREYFRRVIQTGKPQISDAFPAAWDNSEENYTVCAPFKNEHDTVTGAVVIAVPFSYVDNIVLRPMPGERIDFMLLGADNRIMAAKFPDMEGKAFTQLMGSTTWASDREKSMQNVLDGKHGSFFAFSKGRLVLILHAPVSLTQWKLLTIVDVVEVSAPFVQMFLLSSLFIIVVFMSVVFLAPLAPLTPRKTRD